MSKILYKNCQKYLPSKSRLWGQILFWKTHQNPTLQNCQNFQELSKIVKNIGYMMPSFGGWMFLLDICCQLLEKICKSLPHRSVDEDVCFKFTQGASHFSLKTTSGHCESESQFPGKLFKPVYTDT